MKTRRSSERGRMLEPGRALRVLARFMLGLAIAALATVAGLALWPTVPPSPFLFVYPAVMLAASCGGRVAGATTVVGSTFALIYWLLPPTTSFQVAAWRDVLDLAIFSATSMVIVELIVRTRRALRAATAAADARDAVLAIVAHDLRNPLHTIGLNAELLSAALPAGSEQAEARVARIRRATARARRLVDDVIDSARLYLTPFPIAVASTSLSSLVDECVAPFEAVAKARSIELALPSAEAMGGSIVCDRDRVIQVLSNVLSNALRYTPAGGKVALEVRRRPESVRFEITDTGIGMTRDEVAHAFDRLWHGRGPGHGSGLGLWVSRALVAAHGGIIEAASELGRGTRLTIVLPQPALSTAPGGEQVATAE